MAFTKAQGSCKLCILVVITITFHSSVITITTPIYISHFFKFCILIRLTSM